MRKLDKMICGIHFGSIKLYEGSVDVEFVGKSLSFPTFETMCFWQLLAAELQGDANRIGSFFDNSQIRATLRSNCKSRKVFYAKILELNHIFF